METKLSDIRKEYNKGRLIRCNTSDDPFLLFRQWMEEAISSGEDEPTAMILATVSDEGKPSTRTVLLKGLEGNTFVFYTNYESRKGRQIARNPYVSLSFVWHKLERQIHIEGKVERVSPETSDQYFSSRPYKSRIGARISPQSQPIRNRMEIVRAFVSEAIRSAGKEVERPHQWGGFAVTPTRMEFWQGRANRLHDRIEFALREDGSWNKERLAP